MWPGPELCWRVSVPLALGRDGWRKVSLSGEHVPSGLGRKMTQRRLQSGPDISIVIADATHFTFCRVLVEPSWGLAFCTSPGNAVIVTALTFDAFVFS